MTSPYTPPVQPAAQPMKPRKPKKWPWILGIIAAFGFGAAVGSSGNSTPSTTAAPTTVTQQQPAPAGQTKSSAAPAAPAAPAGPKTEFGDGTFLVGTDIAAGSYKSSGPRAGDIPNCYWARMKDDSGSMTSIIANNNTQGSTRITVKAGEFLQISGCDFTKG